MPDKTPIRTAMNVDVKIIDAQRGICDYTASDQTMDCYREVVLARGWKFDNFKKNAPFVDSHNYGAIGCLLGKVTDFGVQGDQLVERVQWAIDVPEQTYAAFGWKMTAAGYLKAVSVGFFSTRAVTKWDSDPKGFNDALALLKLPEDQAVQLRCVHLEQQQIELSACIIGANPNALARAHKDGAVTDADLSAIGFGDDEMHFLAYCRDETASQTLRAMIGKELSRVALANYFRQEQQQQHATRSATAAQDREAAGRQREAFLSELKRLTHPEGV